TSPVPPPPTPIPPTNTPIPPTNTPFPPTATLIPPTHTPVPPTATLVPLETAEQADEEFLPADVLTKIISQGVVALPEDDVQWRIVRSQAPMPADAPFKARPLGFVLPLTG